MSLDEGLRLETSAVELFTVVNLCYQLVDNTKLPCYTIPPTLHRGFGKDLLPFKIMDCLVLSPTPAIYIHMNQHFSAENSF